MVSVLSLSTLLDLERELEWLSASVTWRFGRYFQQQLEAVSETPPDPPDFSKSKSAYAQTVNDLQLNIDERLLLILALAPHLNPVSLDPLFLKNPDTDKSFTEFGGTRGTQHNGFIPTGQTAAFLIGGTALETRKQVLRYFEEQHSFAQRNIISLGPVPMDEPLLSGTLSVSRDFLDMIIFGKSRSPRFGYDFPAKLISTTMEWEDLVLNPIVTEHLEELTSWLKYHQVLMEDWGMGRKVKPGFRTLFYGPPGTGKTLTASLLGKVTGRPVFRIDLSLVVSKYIGETEKNLSRVFAAAENKDWVLFFDEADSLFGKRTKVSDSNDRYANQEVSYLLQRVEEYAGLVILASNLKSNIDEAFVRRFQSIIHFPLPDAGERLKLWTSGFSSQSTLDDSIDLSEFAQRFEMSGASIMNAIQHCSLLAIRRSSNCITVNDLMEGIRKEYAKEGRTF